MIGPGRRGGEGIAQLTDNEKKSIPSNPLDDPEFFQNQDHESDVEVDDKTENVRNRGHSVSSVSISLHAHSTIDRSRQRGVKVSLNSAINKNRYLQIPSMILNFFKMSLTKAMSKSMTKVMRLRGRGREREALGERVTMNMTSTSTHHLSH